MKKVIGKSQKSEVDHEAVEERLREEIAALKEEMRGHQRQQVEFQRQVERIKESEVSPAFCTEISPMLTVILTGCLANAASRVLGEVRCPRRPDPGVQEQRDATPGQQ